MVGGNLLPPIAESCFLRPRLQAMLDSSWLALEVKADPGFGKTTLVAEWASKRNVPVVWIDASTNLSQMDSILSSLPTGGLLVVDQADHVTQPELLARLRSLVGHYRLVLISRGGTQVPLSNLRIQGRVRTILADDLRFTLRETYALLDTLWRSRLSTEQIRTLWTFCRGWVAGFALAHYVEHQVQGTGEFGQREWMLWDQLLDDYFVENVLTHLSADLQQVMVDTADLPFLSEDLEIPEISRTTLRELATAVPMLEEDDLKPGRYRFDPLLAASLRRRAQQSATGPWPSPGRRALVEQLAANGDVRAAADLALRIGDADLLRGTLRQVGEYLASRSKLGELIMWLDQLPPIRHSMTPISTIGG